MGATDLILWVSFLGSHVCELQVRFLPALPCFDSSPLPNADKMPSPFWILLFLAHAPVTHRISLGLNFHQEKFLCIFWGSKGVKGWFANDFWGGDPKMVLFHWTYQIKEWKNSTYWQVRPNRSKFLVLPF